MKKVTFSFVRRHAEFDEREYGDFADQVVKAVEYVTDGLWFNEHESGIIVVNAQCDDGFCYTQRFKDNAELREMLRDESYNGWELTDGAELSIEVGERDEGNFYIRSERVGEEDYVMLAIRDTRD